MSKTLTRYIISTLRVFVAGFCATLLFTLQNTQTLTEDSLAAALMGAAVAGLSLVLKGIIEGGTAEVKKLRSKPVVQG